MAMFRAAAAALVATSGTLVAASRSSNGLLVAIVLSSAVTLLGITAIVAAMMIVGSERRTRNVRDIIRALRDGGELNLRRAVRRDGRGRGGRRAQLVERAMTPILDAPSDDPGGYLPTIGADETARAAVEAEGAEPPSPSDNQASPAPERADRLAPGPTDRLIGQDGWRQPGRGLGQLGTPNHLVLLMPLLTATAKGGGRWLRRRPA